MATEITNKLEALDLQEKPQVENTVKEKPQVENTVMEKPQQGEFFTAMENCRVTRPDNTPPYTSMAERPIYDTERYKNYIRPVRTYPDRSWTEWVPAEGYVRHTAANGTIFEWYARPTIQQIWCRNNEGTYTQFNKDGSIFEAASYGNWFWGPQDIEVLPSPIDEDQDESYSDDCGCHNDYRCCGWYPAYEDRY